MKHYATPDFWYCYRQLPSAIREIADDKFSLLRENSDHPSLRFKKTGAYWSVRVNLRYRALARDRGEGLVWFWIGSHSEYDHLLSQ